MLSFLETLLTLVGVILILALVNEHLVELFKSGVALKSVTRTSLLKGLMQEASAAEGLTSNAGEAIHELVVERLRGIGQSGFRRSAIRLDDLDAAGLRSIIESIDWHEIPGVGATSKGAGQRNALATRAEAWYPIAMNAVGGRHGRRVRLTAIVASLLLVVGLNANAFTLLERSRNDPAFRASIETAITEVDALVATVGSEIDDASATEEIARAQASLRRGQQSLDDLLARLALEDDGILAQIRGPRDWRNPVWWAGIAVMALLVSLGAPFWHDALGSLMGWHQKMKAQAISATREPTSAHELGPQKEASPDGGGGAMDS